MSEQPRLWIWFNSSSHWMHASEVGARTLFIEYGMDVAWGARAPTDAGVHPDRIPALLRPTMWAEFIAAIAKNARTRRRMTHG